MEAQDIAALIHPTIAVAFVFPLIGMVVKQAWQTRQRRLQIADKGKSSLPPIVGQEHLKIGRWLMGSVVILTLLGLAYPILSKTIEKQTWTQEPLRIAFVAIMFPLTIASLVFLFKAREKLWRGVFATLTGMGLIILGSQPEIYHRNSEWFISHYYYGIAAAMLMIFSQAIVPDIYQDRLNRWRKVHIVLNCLALLLFIGQGFTGTRDLLEIPLSWQEQHIYKCDFNNKTCP